MLLVCVSCLPKLSKGCRRRCDSLIYHSRPIATYGGQGAAKPGIDVKKHAIIYMQGARPHRQPGEPQMVKEPIEVEPYAADRKLDRMSRVNFGKIYTVEHNVKVLPVGRITGEFERRLLEYTRSELS